MIVGGYSMDAYCDNASFTKSDGLTDKHGHHYKEFPHNAYAQKRQTCERMLRDKGWLISDTRALCPKCSGKKPKPTPKEDVAYYTLDELRAKHKAKS